MMSYNRTFKHSNIQTATTLYLKMPSFDHKKIDTEEDKNVAKLDKSKL